MYIGVDIIKYIALEEIFMISKISVEDRNLNSKRTNVAHKNQNAQNPAFKGGLWALALQGIQECEKNPMVNVSPFSNLSPAPHSTKCHPFAAISLKYFAKSSQCM